jgi:hypothetical protein
MIHSDVLYHVTLNCYVPLTIYIGEQHEDDDMQSARWSL